MSILTVNLAEIIGSGELRKAEETETYIVTTDSSESARTLRMLPPGNAAGLPVSGEVSPTTLLTASKIKINRDPQSRPANQVFYYQVDWSTPDRTNGGGEANPIDEPAQIDWGGIEFEEVAQFDLSDPPLAFRNSAGEMYNPQPVRVVLGGACTITRNQLENPASICTLYSYTTNADGWFGINVGYAKFGIISATKQYWSGEPYWQVTFPIQFKRNGWQLKVLDNGFNELVTGALRRITTLDEDGNKVPTNIPSFLNGSGVKLASGADPVYYPTGGFQMSEETTWATLGLPNPFE